MRRLASGGVAGLGEADDRCREAESAWDDAPDSVLSVLDWWLCSEDLWESWESWEWSGLPARSEVARAVSRVGDGAVRARLSAALAAESWE